ncbi:hypothetical protein ACFQ6N_39880 [Kitasatospora sp. NPDC056446]|uniref:hypothetical protein n=1 Tax=Kitasatospora sp. NPDC056446 TaxID=3345819 RepID=UPI0036A82063
MLLRTIAPARRLDVLGSHEALAQACAATGDDVVVAELISDGPNHLWSLASRPRVLAIVHPDLDEAWALIRSVQFLRQHRVAVTSPSFTEIRAAAGGRAVTFWQNPGQRSPDTSLSAWVTALTHRIDPGTALWLGEHDPFDGLLDGLDDAPLDGAVCRFLRERVAQLREEWDYLDWPTPDTVILGADRMVPCHDDGVRVGFLLRRPLRRGHREWDLVAARWRSELLTGPREDHRTFAGTYLSYQSEGRSPAYPYIGAWSGYQVVRDVVVLTAVMDAVRRAHLDGGLRREAAHRVACLRGAHPAPWNWGKR